MEQQIQFCGTKDGSRLAYTSVGKGPPLVVPPPWISHQGMFWQNPYIRRFWERLARHHTLVCYDRPGTGLSDRNRTEFSLDSDLNNLETVIGHLKLRRLALLGISSGGPVAAAYAARYPRRVNRLILYGSFARGETIATEEIRALFVSLVRANWGLGAKILADLFIPSGDPNDVRLFARYQRECATPEIAAKMLDLTFEIDVRHLLAGQRVPTLVLHRERDQVIPLRCGRELASLIPNALFVPLEGADHIPWLGDSDSMLRAVADFLGDPVPRGQMVQPGQPAPQHPVGVVDEHASREARSFIASLDWIVLSRYKVVGDYTRYDENVRNMLKDVRQRICAAFDRRSRKRENHLIRAAPGAGKTYFIQQVADSQSQAIRYQECNLAKHSHQDFVAGLSHLDAESKPCLCLIDEVDAKPNEAWPYEVLLPYLDATADGRAQYVFVLAGSYGSSLEDIKKQIASRPKGVDLLSRIPDGNEYEIPPMNLGDRLLVVVSQFRQAGQQMGQQIQGVEKLGLYYIALNSRLANARQLRELAVRAVERLPAGDDRVKYDHLFGAGDPENKAFWMQSLPAANDLANRFVTLED